MAVAATDGDVADDIAQMLMLFRLSGSQEQNQGALWSDSWFVMGNHINCYLNNCIWVD